MARNHVASISLTAGLTIAFILLSSPFHAAQGASKKMEYYDVPVRSLVYRPAAAAAAASTEAYEPFELCMGCRCCASSNTSSCVNTRCCYAIDCNIPGKPFGVCAFSPHTCGCGANNCTNQA